MRERTRAVSDLALAAYFVTSGDQLTAIQHSNGRGVFIFGDTPALEQETLDFYNRRASVDPMTFAETLRNLRAAAKMG